MQNINEILARAAALRDETQLNSISPERAGGIMYDTLLALNDLWLQQGAALVISKIYASVAAMEADTAPVSDLTGQPLRPGQIVVIASSDSDNGSVYRYNGTDSPSWSLVGEIGNLEPVDSLDSDSTQLPLAAHQGKVLDGKISQLGQELTQNIVELTQNIVKDNAYIYHDGSTGTNKYADDSDWYVGEFIPVSQSDVLSIVTPVDMSSNSPQKIGLYDDNKELINYYAESTRDITISQGAYIALSVRKVDASSFKVLRDGTTLYAGSNIDNNIPVIKISLEKITEDINEAEQKQSEFEEEYSSSRKLYKIEGKGETYSYISVKLIKGRKYQIVFDNPSWARNNTGTTANQNILGISSVSGGVSTDLLSVRRSQDTGTIGKICQIDVPVNSEFINIGGRANIGTDIVFSLQDITEIIVTDALIQDVVKDNAYIYHDSESDVTRYVESNDWYVGELIPINQGDVLRIITPDDITVSSLQRIGFYNSNKELFDWASLFNRDLTISLTDAVYIALSVRKSDAPSFKVLRRGEILYAGTNVNLSVPYLEKRVEQIEGYDIYSRNKDKLPLLFASSNKNLRLQILIATDSHEGWGALQNAVNFANQCDNIHALFVLGDCTGQAYPSKSTFDRYNEIINTCVKPVFCIAGNHDCGYDQRLRYTALEDKICEYITEPTYQHLAVGEFTQGQAYYFHDFTDKKVRVIFLYEYDETISLAPNSYWEAVAFDSTKPQYAIGVQYAVNDIVNFGLYTANSFRCIQAHTSSTDNEIKLNEYRGYRFIGQTQMAWLVSTMLSTPADYNIVICSHIPASADYNNSLFRTSKFCTKFLNIGNGFNGMAGDYLGILAEAFNNGSSGSIKVAGKGTFTYMNTQEDAGVSYAYEVQYNFSTKNSGAKFMCFLSGHTHVDCIFKNGRNQFCITPTFTTATTRQFDTNDVPRNSDPKELAYDALTAVAFDIVNDCVDLTRVGTTATTDGYLRDVDRIDL